MRLAWRVWQRPAPSEERYGECRAPGKHWVNMHFNMRRRYPRGARLTRVISPPTPASIQTSSPGFPHSSPKAERLPRALGLKSLSVRLTEHSAPRWFVVLGDRNDVLRFKSQFDVDLALHVELLRSSRIKFEPTYLYCSDFAGGAQCMLEFPVVF